MKMIKQVALQITDQDYQLSKSRIVGKDLLFSSDSDFYKALSDGFFLLEIPNHIEVLPGLNLCHNFYKDNDGHNDSYKGFKKHQSLYFDRPNFQTEHILTDQQTRKEFFPTEVKQLADKMNNLAIIILENVLKKLNVPEKDWDLVTGHCVQNKGTHWFACSHYRSEIQKPGCPTHQDTGFVTVLYIDEPGLQAYINKKWENINPVPGYFIINFGRSFEILTEKLPVCVKSVLHRVSQTYKVNGKKDRVSMAAFTNMPNDLCLYQYSSNKILSVYQTVEEFLQEFNKTTWDDHYTDFGLTS